MAALGQFGGRGTPQLFASAPYGVTADKDEAAATRRGALMSTQGVSGALRKLWTTLQSLGHLARAGQWWDYKLVPIFAAFYATALVLQAPVSSLGWAVAQLLLSIIPGAAYVSFVNDLADEADDRAAGKPNRMAGRSPAGKALLICLPVAAGLGFAWLWRDSPLLLGCYLGAWAAFTLYSLPPVRLKTRGGPGLLADAAGAHMFPALVAAALAAHVTGRHPGGVWLFAIAVWAMAYGIRGILWHQIGDADNDDRSKVATFVQRHSTQLAGRLGAWVIFPVELAAFGVLLWRLDSGLVVAGLITYALFCWARIKWLKVRPAAVMPGGTYFLIGHLYYDLLFPISLLLAYAAVSMDALWLVVLQLALFPGRILALVDELRLLAPRIRRAVAARVRQAGLFPKRQG